MARIALVTTGGTIASRLSQASGDVRVAVAGADLARAAASGVDGVELEVVEFSAVASFSMGLGDALRLARTVEAVLARPDIDGAVVTHGTDTMEESAYLCHLTVPSPKPVAFTGAQIPAGEDDTDGPRNIRAAILVAAYPPMREQGTVVVFDGEAHAAREATKTHTSRTDTFQSPGWGALASVDRGRVAVKRRIASRRTYACEAVSEQVALIKLAMGMDGGFLRFAAGQGARAIVLEAFGRGNVPAAVLAEATSLCAAGTPVFVASRCPQGSTAPIYGNGGGKDLAAAGATFLGDLAGVKARVLLSVLFGSGLNASQAIAEVGSCVEEGR